MIDGEKFLYTLLRRDVDAGVKVSADIDVDTMDHLPYLTFTLSEDSITANGAGLWFYNLTVNLFADGMDATIELAGAVDDILTAWAEDPARTFLDGIGSMPSIDVGVFTRTAASEIGGRNVVQYTGASALALRTIQ